MEKISSLALGGVGYATSVVESGIIKPEFDYSQLVSAITQISIAVVTIISLFKTQKPKINPKN